MSGSVFQEAVRPPRFSRQAREAVAAYLFLTPNIISIGGFVLIPLIAGFLISLTDWDLLSEPNWVGFDNYERLWFDPIFWKSMRITFVYALIVIPGGLVASLALAAGLVHIKRGLRIYQILFFLPYVSSTIAVALVWKWVLNPEYGIVNPFLEMLGLPAPNWITDPDVVIITVAIVTIWQTAGYNAIILLAGMKSIPVHYYEAARMDGATYWQQYFRITLPLLLPSIFFVSITSLLASFIQSFNIVFVMTEGGPGNSSKVIMYYVWESAFSFFKMGYASAISYALSVVLMIIALGQAWLMGRSAEQMR